MLFISRFSRRDPFAATDDVTGKLVVALYAWDGNSFPGNEYWVGQTGSSGDSAAASCSQVENSKKNTGLSWPPFGLIFSFSWCVVRLQLKKFTIINDDTK